MSAHYMFADMQLVRDVGTFQAGLNESQNLLFPRCEDTEVSHRSQIFNAPVLHNT